MKKINSILFSLLFLFTVIACNNDDDAQDDSNFISSKINQVNWNGIPEFSLNQANDTLTLLGHGNEQVMVFKIKFNGEGVYHLSGKQASYYTTLGEDVITSNYLLDASSASQITVTNYNVSENKVKGYFNVTLLKDWSNPENTIDVINLSNGEFRGTITD